MFCRPLLGQCLSSRCAERLCSFFEPNEDHPHECRFCFCDSHSHEVLAFLTDFGIHVLKDGPPKEKIFPWDAKEDIGVNTDFETEVTVSTTLETSEGDHCNISKTSTKYFTPTTKCAHTSNRASASTLCTVCDEIVFLGSTGGKKRRL